MGRVAAGPTVGGVRVTPPPTVDLETAGGDAARLTGLATDLGPVLRLGADRRLQFRFGRRRFRRLRIPL